MNVYAITLRARDGRERTDLWWLPTPEALRDYHDKVAHRGLTIANEKIIL
jgi:hypothetical protein